jgi:signal transduction histidine kinase
MAQIDGTALQLLWPSRPGWNAFAALPLGIAFGVAAAAFARVFLRTRAHAWKLDRAFNAAIGIGAAWLGAALFIDDGPLKRASLWLALALSALCTAGAIVTWLRGRTSARFYAVGCGAMFVAVALAAAAHLALLPLGVGESVEILKGSIVLDALMFATAMADSARETRPHRDAAVRRALDAVAEQELASDRLHAARTARVEAQLLAEQQDQALASVSHGVRAPLAGLRTGIAGLALERRVSAETAARFAGGVDYLERLARSYSGTAGPGARGRFRTGALMAEVESLFRDEALAKGLVLRCRTCSLEARGDATATLRILANLVANAVKYTRAGKVLIGCRRRVKDALGIVVADTGPGMSQAELDVALEPYGRGAAGRRTEGAGLGLAITARLAADSGYRFTARAEAGRGSLFEIVVPLASPVDPEPAN